MTEFNKLWKRIKKHIAKVGENFDMVWRKRIRSIDTQLLINFIFKLILSKNKQGYGSVLVELWENFSNKKIETTQDNCVSASSICEARQKLPEEVFKVLNDRIIEEWEKIAGKRRLYKGHRVFAVDGTKINLPRQLIEYGYKTPGQHSYYPQGLVSCLYEVKSGIPYDFELAAHNNERTSAMEHLAVLSEGDLVIFDRGYYSYELLREYTDRKVLTIFRLQRNVCNKEILEFWRSKETEKIIEVNMPKKVQKKKKEREDLSGIRVRLVKYIVGGEEQVIATTLLAKEYPIEIFKELYHQRWRVEELYKISKELIDVEDLHAQTERGIKQEIYAHFALITITRIFDKKAEDIVREQEKEENGTKRNDVEHMRTNFKNSLLVIGRRLEELIYLNAKKFIRDCVPKILKSISRIRQRIRPGRHYLRISRRPIKRHKNTINQLQRMEFGHEQIYAVA